MRKVFLYVKFHIFRFFFLKRHTYHVGFQKYFIRSGKIPEYTAIAGPRENEREVASTTALTTGKIENYFWKLWRKIKRQHKFQKQVLELKNRSSPTKNEFSFSQNAIWSSIENFSYSPEEDVIFTSYFRRYEDLSTTNCADWIDSKKLFFWGNLGQQTTQNS